MEVDKNGGKDGHETKEDRLLEKVTFDICFYIYIGSELMELKQVQQLLSLETGSDGKGAKSEKEKNVENLSDGSYDEIKSFQGSSVSKAA
ncbi:unnamed protein product [Lactuca virosa]|uniref:DUF7798 domain-containing protein n=1 Tax=Lactuca virosa TaxID=75947 RepID=A0AAU9NNB7_9ASTR|nr:unnamed protein product [Lactuca virosa]